MFRRWLASLFVAFVALAAMSLSSVAGSSVLPTGRYVVVLNGPA